MLGRVIGVPLAVLVAALAVGAAPASTRTVSAVVIAPAASDAAGATRLPLLLGPRGRLRAGRPVVAPVVPRGSRPIRWGTGRMTLAGLRPGDRLRVDLRGDRARRIVLRRSGRADEFGRIVRRFAELQAVVRETIAVAGPITAATSTSVPRDQVTALRHRLALLGAALEAIGTDVDVSLERLGEVRPREQAPRAAVVAAQQPYASQLAAVRDAARAAVAEADAAAELLDAVADVPGSADGTANPPPSTAPIEVPLSVIGAVGRLANRLADLAERLGHPLGQPYEPGGVLDPAPG
jgi:bifunctional DNA-binding transcriptional regulator/antitoxin component of YhaV-PrlF toxin-antitoxin module